MIRFATDAAQEKIRLAEPRPRTAHDGRVVPFRYLAIPLLDGSTQRWPPRPRVSAHAIRDHVQTRAGSRQNRSSCLPLLPDVGLGRCDVAQAHMVTLRDLARPRRATGDDAASDAVPAISLPSASQLPPGAHAAVRMRGFRHGALRNERRAPARPDSMSNS